MHNSNVILGVEILVVNAVDLARAQRQAADDQRGRQVGIVFGKDFAVGNIDASLFPLTDQGRGDRIAREVERDFVDNVGAKRTGQGNSQHLAWDIGVRRRQIWERGAEEKSALLSGLTQVMRVPASKPVV